PQTHSVPSETSGGAAFQKNPDRPPDRAGLEVKRSRHHGEEEGRSPRVRVAPVLGDGRPELSDLDQRQGWHRRETQGRLQQVLPAPAPPHAAQDQAQVTRPRSRAYKGTEPPGGRG